eukprot:scaffold10567_cov101-Isochrysis_galbana.AAC.3
MSRQRFGLAAARSAVLSRPGTRRRSWCRRVVGAPDSGAPQPYRAQRKSEGRGHGMAWIAGDPLVLRRFGREEIGGARRGRSRRRRRQRRR